MRQTIGSVGDCDKLESRALCGPNQTFKKYHVGQTNLICESSKTSGPSVYGLYQSLGTSQKDVSSFHPSACSLAPLRQHDGLLKWRKGRGGHAHWKTECRSISSNIIHQKKNCPAISTLGSGRNVSWARLHKIAIEAQLLAQTKAAFDH